MFDYACNSFQSISPLCRFDRICGSWDKEPYLHIAVLRFNLAKTRSMNEKRIVLWAKSYFYTKDIKKPDDFVKKVSMNHLFLKMNT